YLMLSGRVKNMIVTSGGKNVYPEEIEDMFQLESEISQITVQGYIAEGSDVSEELEALVYPDDSLFARLGVAREDKMSDNVVKAEVQEIVNKINRKLLPYQRITRLTILEKPLEMTTTLKVKRNYKK
ncbi:MAG: long-chain fatty acid--CoA ligase, partial [Treponema sp.]|nr:long-chain fatty acid--CoA ligase [Treponema sp.]